MVGWWVRGNQARTFQRTGQADVESKAGGGRGTVVCRSHGGLPSKRGRAKRDARREKEQGTDELGPNLEPEGWHGGSQVPCSGLSIAHGGSLVSCYGSSVCQREGGQRERCEEREIATLAEEETLLSLLPREATARLQNFQNRASNCESHERTRVAFLSGFLFATLEHEGLPIFSRRRRGLIHLASCTPDKYHGPPLPIQRIITILSLPYAITMYNRNAC